MSDRSPGSPTPAAPSTCYVCRIGDNMKDAIERRAKHESARGKKIQRR